MKKIILVLVCCLLFQTCSEARDYAKLQVKEIKHAQKYGVSAKYKSTYAPSVNTKLTNIKDPKLLKLGDYKEITEEQYKAKLAKDEQEYAKIAKSLNMRKPDNYNSQAYSEDFYKVYRIAERLIRANNLEFINWRFSIEKNTDFNAYSSNTNNVTILTGLYDTFNGNDDALALAIGHEMGHGLLGHSSRKSKLIKKMNRAYRMNAGLAWAVTYRRLMADSKNMEYAADLEGAKFAAKAGYDLKKARETLEFMNTLDDGSMEYRNTHPNAAHRIQNYEDNRKYFPMEEWTKQGMYNIYNSPVLKCQKSSDRKSIIILRDSSKPESAYNATESVTDVYKRYGYMAYINGEFKDAVKYFKKVLDEDRGDYAVYLYTSYAYEYLGDKESAKEFANYAKQLAPSNKYVREQVENL
jgi:predicted Zn-dependent protease